MVRRVLVLAVCLAVLASSPRAGVVRAADLAKAVASSHKVVFWKNNFDYLDDPAYDDWHVGECLKRHRIGPCSVLDVGGSYRLRYHNEQGIRRLGVTGNDDEFTLHQTRLYGNLEIGRSVRLYAEMIDAVSFDENFPPRGTEENRTDMLNLFGDFLLHEGCRGDVTLRVGREELIYGAQRLVSPLPWGNTRRTFEGGKLVHKYAGWDTQAFWVRPMNVNPLRFDTPDQSREFMGIYATHKVDKTTTLDLFFLRFLETDAAGFDYNTFGCRYEGGRGPWVCEGWLAGQFGEVGGATQSAWAYTLGLGRKFSSIPWKPTLWAYFDFATGDDNGNGFHHLFPLGHKYLGFMDLFGRRNLEDINFRLTATPTKKVKLMLWWHIFHLQNRNDVPYNVNLTPFVPVAGGSSYLGQELDLTLAYKITPRANVLLGYSHFFTGDWYRTNPTPPPSSQDADFYYVQFIQNF